MHTNYRRKAKRKKYHSNGYCARVARTVSKKWWKRHKSSKRRAQERELLDLELYDDFPLHYNRDILWDMF